MTALVPSSEMRSPRLQTYFLDNNYDDHFLKQPMPEYYEAENSSSSPPSTTNSSVSPSPVLRPAAAPPIYTPTLSSLSLDAASEKEEGNDEGTALASDEDDETAVNASSDQSDSRTSQSTTTSTTTTTTTTTTATSYRPTPIYQTASDDSSIEDEPDRHVDYLSHEWREEDIWASWRYVVSRRDRYSNGVRLENASWRTWTKSKYQLRTVRPETLNWLKDCDVTWLYGPLQTDKSLPESNKSPPPSQLSSANSFVDRKSILKKKTASEAILQRSLSQHTLLKHAGAILQAQNAEHGRGRPSFARATSDGRIPLSRRAMSYSADSTQCTPTNSTSSGLMSPTAERRHIHFNNKVEQCIAVEAKDDEEHVLDASDFFLGDDQDDTESDDGIVMMKQFSPRTSPGFRSTPRNSFSNESKTTIAPLPSTTLKYRSDTPEPPWGQPQNKRDTSPSPSIETLRPSRPEANFLLNDGDNDEYDAYHSTTNVPQQQQQQQDDFPRDRPWFVDPKEADELDNGGNLHLTPSGMFMPYEDSDSASAGIFGRIVDTVNTARDIAHVIWNVGWRR